MTIKAPSPKFIKARWHGGPQDEKDLKWVVLHSTVSPCEPGGAQAIAEFFAKTDHPASAHYVVDTAERRQCVGDHTVAYHCGYNYGSLAVEMCEYPSNDVKRWNDTAHRQLEINAAHLVARLCLVYKIRPYYVGRFRLLAGWKGVTTHAQMSKAFKKSTHWDPGAWPRLRFMREVRRHYRHLKARAGR
jgi:N-acetylmuramoyl-L-alanine amidase CwlA